MLKMQDFNTGPLRMSVTNLRAPQSHSRSHNHRYDQDSENGRGHDQESGKGRGPDQGNCPKGGPFAISFCFLRPPKGKSLEKLRLQDRPGQTQNKGARL